MAKSLRSKWKRKMKAVKRVRYGEKVTEEDLPSSKDGFMMIRVLVSYKISLEPHTYCVGM